MSSNTPRRSILRASALMASGTMVSRILGFVRNAMLITGVMIGFRLAASTVFLNILGLKNTVLFALSHSMPLTLLIAVATIAYKSGGINENFYFSFILASLTQAIIVTICIKILMSYENKNLQKEPK